MEAIVAAISRIIRDIVVGLWGDHRAREAHRNEGRLAEREAQNRVNQDARQRMQDAADRITDADIDRMLDQ